MKKFKVAIEETCVKEFEIKAEDSILALELAKQKYKNGELVLDPGEPQFRQIATIFPSNDSTEWVTF